MGYVTLGLSTCFCSPIKTWKKWCERRDLMWFLCHFQHVHMVPFPWLVVCFIQLKWYLAGIFSGCVLTVSRLTTGKATTLGNLYQFACLPALPASRLFVSFLLFSCPLRLVISLPRSPCRRLGSADINLHYNQPRKGSICIYKYTFILDEATAIFLGFCLEASYHHPLRSFLSVFLITGIGCDVVCGA